MIRLPLLLILILLNTPLIFAQISGKVINVKTKKPLIGAHLIADSESTVSDRSGNFYLKRASTMLRVSHLGYHNDTIILNTTSKNLLIELIPDLTQIEQIIIQGNLNHFPLMQLPSSIGYLSYTNENSLNNLSFIDDLNNVAGVYAHSGTLNTNRITIRGIGSRTPYGSNRIKAYYNGIPLSNGDGTTEIEDLNASNIGSIEVFKGSKSALYGSGLGGVIVINKAKHPYGFHANAGENVASLNSFKTEVGIQHLKKGFYVAGNYSNTKSKGWRQNSSYQRNNMFINAGYKNSASEIDFILLILNTKAYIPSSLNNYVFINSPDSAAQNWLAVKGFEAYSKVITGFNISHRFNANLKNTSQLFFHFYNGYESRPFNILDDDANKWGLRNTTELNFNELKLQLGIEALFEGYNWNIYETLAGKQGSLENKFSENRTPISLFVNGQYSFGKQLIIEAGISLNTLNYTLNDKLNITNNQSGKYTYPTVCSPFLGINMALATNINMYSSLSHGFSAPSVEETLLPDGEINPNLKPETGLNTELGLRYSNKNRSLFMDACVYNIWVSNLLITKRQSEAIFYGDNAGKTWHRGIELSGGYTLKIWNDFPINMQLNYHIIKATFTNYIDNGIDYTNNCLPGIPKQNMTASSNFKTPWGVSFMLQYKYSGRQYLNDLNDGLYPNFQLVNLEANIEKQIKKLLLNASIGVKNLFNKHYASMILVNAPSFGGSLPRYYYPGNPRNCFISIKLGF